MVSAHYRSHVEFSYEALDEAAAGFRRIEHFLERVGPMAGGSYSVPQAFRDAMDDDLGTPAAVAVLYDTVREGNRLLADDPRNELSARASEVHGMLNILGLHPADPVWTSMQSGTDERLTRAVDVLVQGLLQQRADARDAKDFATADEIRDRIKAAGIEVEDTPDGPKWSI
jgi:cysteinyl-tRNA synthetase